jgi:hypothetical protein
MIESKERFERLDRRLQKFHAVSMADVLETIDYLREPGDSVIAGGSLAFGLGNPLSDFDVVICGRDNQTSTLPLEHWVSSLRVDVWTRRRADVDQLFMKGENALADTLPLQEGFGSCEEEQQLKLLHRIAFGLLLDGDGIRPAGYTDYRAVARDLVVREYAERLRESAFLAQAALGADRLLAASVNARQAVEECLHVVLAAKGVPFTGDKWLYECLKEYAPGLTEHWLAYHVLPQLPQDCAAFVAGAVGLCGELTGIDLALDTVLSDVRWAASGLTLHVVGGAHLLVASKVGGLWQLSGDDVDAWNGLQRLEEGTPEPHPKPPAGMVWRGDLLGPFLGGFCLRLHEQGLMRLRWSAGVPVEQLSMQGGLSNATN